MKRYVKWKSQNWHTGDCHPYAWISKTGPCDFSPISLIITIISSTGCNSFPFLSRPWSFWYLLTRSLPFISKWFWRLLQFLFTLNFWLSFLSTLVAILDLAATLDFTFIWGLATLEDFTATLDLAKILDFSFFSSFLRVLAGSLSADFFEEVVSPAASASRCNFSLCFLSCFPEARRLFAPDFVSFSGLGGLGFLLAASFSDNNLFLDCKSKRQTKTSHD